VNRTSHAEVTGRLRAAGCVFAEDEAGLLISAAGSPAELTGMVDRRVLGEPLEHVLGWAEFCGLRIVVEPGVFVPRRRSELLARLAVEIAGASAADRPVVVDLCCGSGAVGAAVVASVQRADVHAADIDHAAVQCARRNLPPEQVYEGDLYAALPEWLRGRVDVLVANAPYVPTDAIPLLPAEARLHEPLVALDGGADGLDVQHRIAAGALTWLAPGGHLLVETSAAQVETTMEIFASSGLPSTATHSTELEATVVTGGRPTS